MQQTAPVSSILLDVAQLTMRFGGLTAVDGVSFQALDRQVTAIIGPNGAGKTTLFNCLTGFYRPTSGKLTLHRQEEQISLESLPAHKAARLGVARTFQNIRLFPSMTVLENVMVAEHRRLMKASGYTFGGLLGLPGYRRAEEEAIEKARMWLDRLMLLRAADTFAGELPYGMQRRLEIARAMCADPVLLCLDEPAAGLNPSESIALRKAIARIRDETQIGILLIEHNMNVVMEISDQVVVLDYGKKNREWNVSTSSKRPCRHSCLFRRTRGRGRIMLKIENVFARYGVIEALRGVSMEARAGEIVTLIGANGAGKTTLMMTICGQPNAASGEVTFDGTDITAMPTDQIVRRGIALVPEGRRIFPRMTVFENLQLGSLSTGGTYFAQDLERVYTLFPRLKERLNQRGGTLSGGEQQMLAIGRALMSRPKLLLLDEPSLGLAPLIIKQIFSVLQELNKTDGLTIFLVEQNAHLALRLAHRGYVLVSGQVTMSGTGAELHDNPEIRAAYLEGAA